MVENIVGDYNVGRSRELTFTVLKKGVAGYVWTIVICIMVRAVISRAAKIDNPR